MWWRVSGFKHSLKIWKRQLTGGADSEKIPMAMEQMLVMEDVFFALMVLCAEH